MSNRQINFTIVPQEPESPADGRREYANFCAVSHTPFDLTLTFCDVRPLSEQDVRNAEGTQTLRVPVIARLALPFALVPDALSIARATPGTLEPLIHATGFYRMKARALIGMAQALVERHEGQVPASMEALVELPGVGRKTANVVLGHALGAPGLPVDRHVLRVANRLSIATSNDPEVVEKQLQKALPNDRWTRTSDTLILHGRRICR